MFMIETERLTITEFTPDMAQAVHENSLDEDNRRFVPDEVFETVEEAAETIGFLMSQYGSNDGPLIYPVLLKDSTNIGYVQAVPLDDGVWEIGFHIGILYTNRLPYRNPVHEEGLRYRSGKGIFARHYEAARNRHHQRHLPV